MSATPITNEEAICEQISDVYEVADNFAWHRYIVYLLFIVVIVVLLRRTCCVLPRQFWRSFERGWQEGERGIYRLGDSNNDNMEDVNEDANVHEREDENEDGPDQEAAEDRPGPAGLSLNREVAALRGDLREERVRAANAVPETTGFAREVALLRAQLADMEAVASWVLTSSGSDTGQGEVARQRARWFLERMQLQRQGAYVAGRRRPLVDAEFTLEQETRGQTQSDPEAPENEQQRRARCELGTLRRTRHGKCYHVNRCQNGGAAGLCLAYEQHDHRRLRLRPCETCCSYVLRRLVETEWRGE
jgi:hypothetical protein